jgi:hypothetical protein
MDPNQSSPNIPSGGELSVGPTPEDLTVGRLEHAPRRESAPAPRSEPQPASSPPADAPVALPVLSADDVAAAVAAVPGPNGPGGAMPSPTTAEDVDVIEPEWVDKAESVVKRTQGDPYAEEEAIEELNEEYLEKRYGYKVADPNQGKPKAEGK